MHKIYPINCLRHTLRFRFANRKPLCYAEPGIGLPEASLTLQSKSRQNKASVHPTNVPLQDRFFQINHR